MNDFNYYAPTKVVFGKGAEQKVGNLIKEQNCKKVLIHYGSGSARRSGLLDRIEAIFDKEGITYVELGGVVPNPRLSLVYEGIALCKKENVDFILAVGGGSVIDSAKAIGYGVANEGDVWDFFDFKRKPTACLPIGVVLTIAAAGSEMSGSCVITKEDGGMKRGCTTDYSRLKFAVLDPELTMTLPPYQTACGCTDILMHTMERYFNHSDNMELTDGISEALMRTVIRNAKILVKEPENYDTRAEIVWAGTLAHNGLLNTGRVQDWASHRIALEMSGLYDIAHGASLSIVYPAWMEYVYSHDKKRFMQFAVRVWDVDLAYGEEDEICLEGIRRMREFFKKLGMPLTFEDAGLPTDAFEEMADKATYGDTIPVGNFVKIGKSQMIDIYKLCTERK